MKLLAVSHSCVVDVNQQLFVSLRQRPQISLALVIPAAWKSEYTGKVIAPSLLPEVLFPVHRLPVAIPGHVSLHFYLRGLTDAIRIAAPDIVFADEEPWSLATAQVTAICRRLRIPFACYTKQNLRKQYPIPFSWIEQATYRSAAAIVSLSEEARAVLRAKGFHGASPLLPHACDLSLFEPRDSADLRAALGLHGTVVGFMGRFVPAKGLDLLVRAMAQVVRQSPETDATLLLVGSGPDEERLRQLIAETRQSQRVVFAGNVPHARAADFMNCMDIVVLPSRTTASWKEQFGRVIVEAMACGVPAIGSSSGEIPNLIRETGGGLVFIEGDASDLASNLLVLLHDSELRRQLGARGRTSVMERYSYQTIAAQLHSILIDLLASPPVPSWRAVSNSTKRQA